MPHIKGFGNLNIFGYLIKAISSVFGKLESDFKNPKIKIGFYDFKQFDFFYLLKRV